MLTTFNAELVSKGESPWVIRAKNIKAEVAVNVDMERKLQQAAEEIRELFKELKLKVNTICLGFFWYRFVY